MSVDDFIKAIAQGSDHFPAGWQWWQVAQTAHRLMLDRAIQTPPPTPTRIDGRGIIIAAGGNTYFSCAFICAYVLRQLGCTLPIEFWHLGPDEITPQQAAAAARLKVTCRDAHTIDPQPRLLAGWELKSFAAIHCPFDEVLFLDADNVPAIDPTYLFDDPKYIERGAIFWPDLPFEIHPTRWLSELTWDVAGIRWRDDRAFETGQFLISKRDCWHELHVAMHLNEHSDFWYRYVYGDKDTYKLAWHRLACPYAMPATAAGWAWPAILQHDLQGRIVFAHACQGKQQLILGERLPALPQADLAVEAAKLLDEWVD